MTKPKPTAVLLTAACLLLLVNPALSGDSYQADHTARFSADEFSFDRVMGYDMVGLKVGGSLTELGKPMLPSKEIRIALPSGMAVTGVQVVNTTWEEIPGVFDIFPSQPPRRIGLPDEVPDFVEPDMETYSSALPYPPEVVEFVHQTDLAGQGMAVLKLYPLQYFPAEKKLILHTSITLLIRGVGGYECGDYLSPNVSEKGRRTYEEMVRDLVQNPEEVELNAAFKSGVLNVPPGGPFDHVIITSSSYASYFQPLVDWHIQKGITDTVITTAWIYANCGGSTNQQKLRDFVSDAYSIWGTSYFLLGGENETVPFEYRTYYSENSPGDQYYSDFDGDWTHEAFVGRVTVGNATEINTFVAKVLKYEKNPPLTNYPLDVLLIGMDYDSYTHCEDLKENIDNYIPSRFNVTKVYDSHGGNHKTAAINALNAGQNLVNHADHSNTTVMGTGDYNHGWGMYNSDVNALYNNNQLSVIVTPGCHPNHMDYNDCIGERFVVHNANQAGVAFNGNARSGWYYSGSPISLSNLLDKQWWVALFANNRYNLGQTIADAKNNFSHSDIYTKQCEWTFNLLGEPEMPIWTDQPGSFAVSHPSTLPPGSSSFPLHVEDATNRAPVNQAYVCLWKGSEVYLTGFTNALGDVAFNPSPSTLGIMLVTVTKHDFLAYEGEADVSGYLLGDANGDGVVDPADVVYLINYLFKEGPAPNPLGAGDANCDSIVDPADVVYLINYLFKEGPEPACP